MYTQLLVMHTSIENTGSPDYPQWCLITEAYIFSCHFFIDWKSCWRVVFRRRVMLCSRHHLTVPELSQTQLHLHLPDYDYIPAASQGFRALQALYVAALCQFYQLSCSNLWVWQPEFLIYRACKFFRLTASVALAVFLPIWSASWTECVSLREVCLF